MDTHLGQDGIDQLALRQGEVGIMIVGEDVAEQQCHPNQCQGGHASAHDPRPYSRHASGKVLPWNTKSLTDGLLVEPWGLAPSLTEFVALALFQDQWMPQELINGILIKGDPLASHPGVLVPDSLLRGPCIGVELHD